MLTFSCSLISFFSPFFSSSASTSEIAPIATVWLTCDFLFLLWVLFLMLQPVIVPFYFQGLGLPVSFSGSWSYSIHKVHIALQEPQMVLLMLQRMAFSLSGKVVIFYLDNSTAKAYECYQGSTVSFWTSLLHMEYG